MEKEKMELQKGEVYVVNASKIFNYNTEYAKSIEVYDRLTNYDIFNKNNLMKRFEYMGVDINDAYILVKYLGDEHMITETGIRVNLFFGYDPEMVARPMSFSDQNLFLTKEDLHPISETEYAIAVSRTDARFVGEYLKELKEYGDKAPSEIEKEISLATEAAYGYNQYLDFKNRKTR